MSANEREAGGQALSLETSGDFGLIGGQPLCGNVDGC